MARARDPRMVPLRPVAVLAALDCGDPDLARELIGRWGAEARDDWTADLMLVVWGHVAARLGTPIRRRCTAGCCRTRTGW
nr:hypothetical protein GCM10020093_105450 [Planobispora longispora]